MLPLVQIKVGETAAKKRRKYRENNPLIDVPIEKGP
jgi:hypothetical protein